ncbi:MAG: ATP-dependent DNA helicase RecG [Moraxella sp.]|nr:ATP-dependent DNA helicase RecG [Moraxella sp.]
MSINAANLTSNLPVSALTGVGLALATRLADLGIYRIFDLLMHLPRDYEDRSRFVSVDGLADGMLCAVSGVISDVQKSKGGLSVCLEDGTGLLVLKFFRTYPALLQTMTVGAKLNVFGEVRINRYGVQMAHPEYFIAGTKISQTGLLPVYPTVKGVHQNKLRQLIKMALTAVQGGGLTGVSDSDLLAVGVGSTGDLLAVLTAIHQPSQKRTVFEQTQLIGQLKTRSHPLCQRLIIEELTAHQLTFLYRKKNLYQHKAPFCQMNSPLAVQLSQNLPFALTNAQQRVIGQIVGDMASSTPMLRLVQGDVGAGKTLVAALSACYAINSGWQVALMAPTEILAEQHFFNFQRWFAPLGVNVGYLAGKQSTKERAAALEKIKDNRAQLVVGTHALFQEGVAFAKLGLVIIDEQHRFGVEQRLKLIGKGVANTTPHQLAMTATPIPRTLAMSMYGDMDVSVIDELPPRRTPITTVTVNRDRRDEVIERIAINCKAGKQAYWVCPLVAESDVLDAQSAELLYQELCADLDIRVGLVHGKMKAPQKQAVMSEFVAGNIDLLVATTVIEVGVDVPNASLMVIENAERLGLSQLHQLRGRVGRGSAKSFCVLLYQTPLSPTGIERLNILRDSNDGFVIAQKDLQLRGAGELLGKRQTGDMGYYLADVVRDERLLIQAKALADRLMSDPSKKAQTLAMIALWLPHAKEYVNA